MGTSSQIVNLKMRIVTVSTLKGTSFRSSVFVIYWSGVYEEVWLLMRTRVRVFFTPSHIDNILS